MFRNRKKKGDRNYFLKKNKFTIIGVGVVVLMLLLTLIAVILSGTRLL